MSSVHAPLRTISWMALFATSHLFADSIALTNLKTIASPFGGFVDRLAINDNGDISGSYFIAVSTYAGFVIPNSGTPIKIVNPTGSATYVTGINNQGTLAGFYLASGGGFNAFTYQAGTYTPVQAGPNPQPSGINNRGDIIGTFSTTGDTGTGFLLSGGTLTTFTVPGHPLDTFPTSINDSGQIAGYFNGASQGFIRQSDGSIQTFDILAAGINDSGVIVGSGLGSNDNSVGEVRIGNTDFTFTYPGAVSTNIEGINNEGEVVGSYLDSSFTSHIFEGELPASIAAPEPSTVYFCAALLIGGFAFLRHRKPE